MGATRQLGFIFCSSPLGERVGVRSLNTDPDEWGPATMCRIAIEVDT